MGIVAKCAIFLKKPYCRGGGVLVPVSQSKFVGLPWPLALNIRFCLRTLRLSIRKVPVVLRCSKPSGARIDSRLGRELFYVGFRLEETD